MATKDLTQITLSDGTPVGQLFSEYLGFAGQKETEIENARDGEANLLAKQNAQDDLTSDAQTDASAALEWLTASPNVTLSTSRSIADSDGGKHLLFSGSSAITITLSGTPKQNLWSRISNAGTANITLSGASTLNGYNTIAPGESVIVFHRGSNVWHSENAEREKTLLAQAQADVSQALADNLIQRAAINQTQTRQAILAIGAQNVNYVSYTRSGQNYDVLNSQWEADTSKVLLDEDGRFLVCGAAILEAQKTDFAADVDVNNIPDGWIQHNAGAGAGTITVGANGTLIDSGTTLVSTSDRWGLQNAANVAIDDAAKYVMLLTDIISLNGSEYSDIKLETSDDFILTNRFYPADEGSTVSLGWEQDAVSRGGTTRFYIYARHKNLKFRVRQLLWASARTFAAPNTDGAAKSVGSALLSDVLPLGTQAIELSINLQANDGVRYLIKSAYLDAYLDDGILTVNGDTFGLIDLGKHVIRLEPDDVLVDGASVGTPTNDLTLSGSAYIGHNSNALHLNGHIIHRVYTS